MKLSYRKLDKTIHTMELTDEQHKIWRYYKRTLAIKEPCKEEKVTEFKQYLKKRVKRNESKESSRRSDICY